VLSHLPAETGRLAHEQEAISVPWPNAKVRDAATLRRLLLNASADIPPRQAVTLVAEAVGPSLAPVWLHVGLWTRDPVSGEIRTSPPFRTSSRANPGRLRAADDWAVLSLIGTERVTDPTTGHSTRVPILPDGSEDAVLVVNLGSWAAHRIPVPAGRAVLNDSIGTDGTHVYVSLRDATASTFQTDELRRYSLARIQEWGTPWIAE
jgi:hypothetical protein